MQRPSDWELIQACRNGDGAAWDALIGRYERLVFFIARHYRLDDADAADVVQMTFISALEALHVFRPDSNVKAWLTTVTRRHCWRVLNRYDRELPADESALELALATPTRQTPRDETLELAEWLHDYLNRLDDKCRQLLLALYFEGEDGLPYDVIVQQLGIARGSIGPTRARCLDKLRALIGEN